MMQSKKIAVTGGIGSGKSTLCGILRGWGYPVFSCDSIAAELWKEAHFLETLSQRFPDCCEGGKIVREKLSARVFADVGARRTLEKLMHPVIMERLIKEMECCPVSFGEVPLLYEGGYEGLFDGVIALRRSEAKRIAAVKERSGLSEEEVRARMRSQIDPAELSEKHCFLLENDGSVEELKRGAERILSYFRIV